MGTFFNKFIAHNEETMNHRTTIAKYILTATLLLGDSLRAAEDPAPTYAKKTGTELSLGFSNLSFSNVESFYLNLLPAVNYYFFDRIFARAGLQLAMDIDRRAQMPNLYRMAPTAVPFRRIQRGTSSRASRPS